MELPAASSRNLRWHRLEFAFVSLVLSLTFLSSTAFAQAVENFDAAVIYRPEPGEYGMTELMSATMDADTSVVASLLEGGADFDAANDVGYTSLMLAAFHGHTDIVRLLLSSGADPDIAKNDGTTALSSAVSRQHTAITLELLEYGANPNVPSIFDRPVLASAAAQGQAEVVDALIAHGADLAVGGQYALTSAAWKGQTKIAAALISAGVDVNALSGKSEQSALHTAAQSGNTEIVHLLLANNADPDIKNKREQTPLNGATGNGHLEVVKALLSSGATVTSDELSLALQKNNGAVAEALIDGLDTRMLSQSEIDALLIGADKIGADEVVAALFDADAAPPIDNGPVRMLYRLRNDEGCNVMLWDPQLDTKKSVYASTSECPEYAFVADGSGEMFLVDDNKVQVISLDDETPSYFLELPVKMINIQLEALKARKQAEIRQAYEREDDLDWMSAKLAAFGYLSSGELAFATYSTGPADGTYAYLYARSGDTWALLEDKGCHRFDECRFSQLNGRLFRDWPLQRTAWHPNLRKNRFFVSKEILRRPRDEWTGRDAAVRFDIDGQISTITYASTEGGHGGGTYTTRVELHLTDSDPILLTNNDGNNSFAGQYVLIGREYRRSAELFDLKTGISVFGQLGLATWIE